MFDTLEWDVELLAGERDETEYCYELTVADMAADWTVGRHVLTADVDMMTPGVFLAAMLASVDPSRLTGYDLVSYVQAQERLVSHHQAAYYTGVAEMAHATDPDTTARDTVPNEFASDELQAALAKTRRSADSDVDFALDLNKRLPQVSEALHRGRIDCARARIFARETTTLDPDLIPDVVEALLEDAGELTTGQLTAQLKKRVIQADPTAATNQYQTGLEDRQVSAYPNPDHTANLLIASITPEDAVEISTNLHDHALQLKRLPGETRTLQQITADLAVDRLKTSNNTSPPLQPKLVIHIRPAEPTAHIPGYGPVLPTTLKTLTTRAGTTTIITPDNTSQTKITTDCHQTTSRAPTKTQATHIRRRYPTCIYPGCRTPAQRCDLDHRKPWHNGGKTTCHNLAPLCRHHHRCKDQGGWQLTRNPNGSHTWTSPLGHTYTTRAPPP